MDKIHTNVISYLCIASVLFWSVNRIPIESCNHRKFRLERSSGALQSNLLLTAKPFLRSSLVFKDCVQLCLENLQDWKLHSLFSSPSSSGGRFSLCQHEHLLFQLRTVLPLPPTMHSCERLDPIPSITSLLSLCGCVRCS